MTAETMRESVDAQAERRLEQERARKALLASTMRRVAPNTYESPSQSQPGKTYRTVVIRGGVVAGRDAWSYECTCRAGRGNAACWHGSAAIEKEQTWLASHPEENEVTENNGGPGTDLIPTMMPIQQSPSYQLDPLALGRTLAKSGYFKDAADEAKAAVKVLAGMELGIGPVAAMMGIHIIEGKPVLSANLLAGRVRSSGRYEYSVVAHDDNQCSLQFYERRGAEWAPIGNSTFTMADAAKAGLGQRDNWKKNPRNMLFARAMSNGVKWYCPDVTTGIPVYTEGDELPGMRVSGDGEILEPPVAPERPTPVLAQSSEREMTDLQIQLADEMAERWPKEGDQVRWITSQGVKLVGGRVAPSLAVLGEDEIASLRRLLAETEVQPALPS